MITIDKIDNTFLQINCSDELAFEIRDVFSCYTKNYKYHPKFKARIWNGKISFFDISTRTLPIGLLEDLINYFVENNYSYKFNFDVSELFDETFTDEELDEFIKSINIPEDKTPRYYQVEALQNSLYRKRGVLEMGTGCHAKGTKIIMFDGTLKNVEDIIVGDLLMGPDNKPRTVLKLYSGKEEMYEIIPKKGKSYIVNKNHILHLHRYDVNDNYNIIEENISVENYLAKSDYYKHQSKLKYNDIELNFENNYEPVLSPYFLGYYLGDGHTHRTAITTHKDDFENIYQEINKNLTYFDNNLKIIIDKYKNSDALTINIYSKVRIKSSNELIKEFEKLNIIVGYKKNRTKCEDKFIPECYKLSSIKNRLELLAGLMDSDGCLGKFGSYYIIASKSIKLMEDVSFVAQSLGFKTRITERFNKKFKKMYYYCCIMGDIKKIPVRLERKKTNFVSKGRDPSRHGFDIKYVGIDNFYGFNLSGDHLYFTDDFLINHNSGKSMNIYLTIRYLLEKYNFKCLLVVPSVTLVNQMEADFKEYNWKNSEEFVDKLYSGQKLSNKPILISTWQSLMNKGRDFLGEFDAVLIDECHSLSDDTMKINNKTKERAITVVKNILIKCEKASYKFGFTGTIPDEECDYLTLFGYIGPKIFEKKTKELMDENFLSQISIANLIFKYPEKFAKEYKDKSFQEEEKFVETYQPRMKLFNFILNSYETPQNTLILCRHIDHLKAIEKYLCDNLDDKFKVSLIYGEVKPEQREYLRKLMNQEDNMILLATFGTMKQGVNIPKIHNVIFGSSYKAKITVCQSIGRGVRLHETKEKLILWDIVDNLVYTTKFGNDKNNYIYEHWLQRLKYYKEQGFQYDNLQLTLKDL